MSRSADPQSWDRIGYSQAHARRGLLGDGLGDGSLAPLERHAWALFEEGAIEVLVEALVREDEPYVHEAAQIGLTQIMERRALGGSAKKPIVLPRGEELLAKATAALDGAIAAAGTRSQRRRLQAALDAVRSIRARASKPEAMGSQGVSVRELQTVASWQQDREEAGNAKCHRDVCHLARVCRNHHAHG